MEEIAREERDFQEQENDDVLEIVYADGVDAITLEREDGCIVFLFEMTEVEVDADET